MDDNNYHHIREWAQKPTSYTSHPKDIERFEEAVKATYLEIGDEISLEAIGEVLNGTQTNTVWPLSDEKKALTIKDYLLCAEDVIISLQTRDTVH